MPSIYLIKPAFQRLLRPAARALANAGITANAVTTTVCVLSVGLGALITSRHDITRLFLLLPVWLFLRMALNAMDGMLAREFGQKTPLGAYLNELTDVISDGCLYLPFAYLTGFHPLAMGAIIVLAIITEMTGTVAIATGASRRYDGPMGKSDRAVAFGALALWIGLGLRLRIWATTIFELLMIGLLFLTIVNRVRSGLDEIHKSQVAAAGR